MRWYANAREVGCGERVTVVLAHGYGVKQASWDALLPSISHANKVLLFDWDFTGGGAREDEEGRLTFGKFADDLIALMDEKGVRGAVLVGHSMSAIVACIASLRRPDLFAHLLLLCASLRYINSEEEEGYVGGFEEAAVHGMLDAMQSDFHGWVRGFVPNAAGDAASVEESFHAMDPVVALELAKMIFLGDQREVLDGVSAPCTIVQVSKDLVAPPSVAEYMQRRMKRTAAAVEIIDSVGHFPQLAAPQQLLDILDGVLLRLHDEVEEEHNGEEK